MKSRTGEEKQDTIRPLLLKRNSSQAVRPHKAHRSSKERMRRRSITRGFLRKCQPPACQGVPVATTDRSGRTQYQAKKTGHIEKTTARANISTRRKNSAVLRNVWRQKAMVPGKVRTHCSIACLARRRESLGEKRLAGPATLPHAVRWGFRAPG